MSAITSRRTRRFLVAVLIYTVLIQPVGLVAQSSEQGERSQRLRRVAIVLYEAAAVVAALSVTALIIAHVPSPESRTEHLGPVGGAGIITSAVLALVGSVLILEVAPDEEPQGRE